MAQSILELTGEYWFWAMAGFLLGGALCARNLVKNGLTFPLAVITITVGLYGGFLGARVLYILIFSPRLVLDNPISLVVFWQGTGTWLGGFFFGAIGMLLVLKATGKPFWSNIGSMTPGLALGHALSRLGCVTAGCCYGAPTTLPWAIHSEKINGMVHPTQIYSMMGELISFAVLQVLWKRREHRKYLPSAYGLLLGSHRFITEFFRGADAGPEIIPGLRVYQSVCVFIIALSLCVFMILRWKKTGWIPAAGLALLIGTLTFAFKPATPEPPAFGKVNTGLYLVVTRQLFREPLGRWVSERKKEGFDVSVRSWVDAPTADDVRAWIERQTGNGGGGCRYILIAGDCGAAEEKMSDWHVPSVENTLEAGQGKNEYITDMVYGDLNRDGRPDVPVGRLAARHPGQLKNLIDKIFTYQDQDPTPHWFRTVIWTGAKGYTSEIGLITGAMTERLPKWMTPFIIEGDPRSAYSGHLPDQPGVFLEQISRPAFLSMIASHGSFRSVTPASYGGKAVFLSVEDVAGMPSGHPSGVMFLLGCDSGKFNTPQALGISLAEAFADHPGGPIGVVAATATTNPLTNYFMARAMMDKLDQGRSVGDFMLDVYLSLYEKGKDPLETIIRNDPFARGLMEAVPENEKKLILTPSRLRHEALMYNLLGDPACELKLPRPMTITVKPGVKGTIIVSGETATLCGELSCELIRVRRGGEGSLEEVNQRPETLLLKKLSGKGWEVQLSLPIEDLTDRDYLRCTAIGPEGAYVGSSHLSR